MTFDILVSATFAQQFRALPEKDQQRLRQGLHALREDPFTPRAGADIKPLKGTEPPKLRLRVGPHRVVFSVADGRVRVIETFRRGRG